MNGAEALDRFLRTDPQDVGCGKAMELLHVYVDLVSADPAAAQQYPGVEPASPHAAPAARTTPGWPAARPPRTTEASDLPGVPVDSTQ